MIRFWDVLCSKLIMHKNVMAFYFAVTGFLSLHPSLDGTTSPPCKKARIDVSNMGVNLDLSQI